MNINNSKIEKIIKKITINCVLLLLLAFVLFQFDSFKSAFKYIVGLTMPFIVGGFLALYANVLLTVIESMMDKIHTFKTLQTKRSISLLITVVLIIISLVFVVGLVAPTVVSSTRQALQRLPSAIQELEDFAANNSFLNSMIEGEDLANEVGSYTNQAIAFIDNNKGTLFTGGLSAITGTISNLFTAFLGFVFSMYVLIEKEHLAVQIKRFLYALFDREKIDVIVLSGRRFVSIFHKFMVGTAKESVIFGLINYAMMKMLGFPAAAATAIIIAVLMIIPYFGGIIAGIIGALLVSTQNINSAVWFLIIYTVLQQLESNVLYPMIVGDEVGLPGLWVMVSVTLGGALMGLMGMIVAVPVATLIYTILGDYISYKTVSKKDTDAKLSDFIEKETDPVGK